MNASMRCLVWSLSLVTTALMAQEIRLGSSWVGAQLRFDIPTEPGKLYELEASQDLRDWGLPIRSWAGDGQVVTHEVSVEEAPHRFFRLVVRESGSGFAPEHSVMTGALVGVTWQGYLFQSATRFSWQSEGGNWTYQKTGPDEGLLTFTYDEDGNDAGVYREEVVLVFKTASSGTYRYSEYYRGIEDPGSVSGGNIVFTFL